PRWTRFAQPNLPPKIGSSPQGPQFGANRWLAPTKATRPWSWWMQSTAPAARATKPRSLNLSVISESGRLQAVDKSCAPGGCRSRRDAAPELSRHWQGWYITYGDCLLDPR